MYAFILFYFIWPTSTMVHFLSLWQTYTTILLFGSGLLLVFLAALVGSRCKLAYLSFHNQHKYCPVVNSTTIYYSAFWHNCICGDSLCILTAGFQVALHFHNLMQVGTDNFESGQLILHPQKLTLKKNRHKYHVQANSECLKHH